MTECSPPTMCHMLRIIFQMSLKLLQKSLFSQTLYNHPTNRPTTRLLELLMSTDYIFIFLLNCITCSVICLMWDAVQLLSHGTNGINQKKIAYFWILSKREGGGVQPESKSFGVVFLWDFFWTLQRGGDWTCSKSVWVIFN